jgi:hypothetical protein
MTKTETKKLFNILKGKLCIMNWQKQHNKEYIRSSFFIPRKLKNNVMHGDDYLNGQITDGYYPVTESWELSKFDNKLIRLYYDIKD